jgi:uncharacterized protein
LRVRGAGNPLDASGVHPERYALVERMAADLGCSVADLMRDPALRQKVKIERYVDENVGLPTLRDILQELAKPGRDPRKEFEAFAFAEGVTTLEDLRPGMKLPGIVTNVTKFGAFVDVGVHQDGLVHLSELSDRFVNDPNDVVKVGQRVSATVMEVDQARKRIALSMKSAPGARRGPVTEGAPHGERPEVRRDGGRDATRDARRDDPRRERRGPPPSPAFGNAFADAFSNLGKK